MEQAFGDAPGENPAHRTTVARSRRRSGRPPRARPWRAGRARRGRRHDLDPDVRQVEALAHRLQRPFTLLAHDVVDDRPVLGLADAERGVTEHKREDERGVASLREAGSECDRVARPLGSVVADDDGRGHARDCCRTPRRRHRGVPPIAAAVGHRRVLLPVVEEQDRGRGAGPRRLAHQVVGAIPDHGGDVVDAEDLRRDSGAVAVGAARGLVDCDEVLLHGITSASGWTMSCRRCGSTWGRRQRGRRPAGRRGGRRHGSRGMRDRRRDRRGRAGPERPRAGGVPRTGRSRSSGAAGRAAQAQHPVCRGHALACGGVPMLTACGSPRRRAPRSRRLPRLVRRQARCLRASRLRGPRRCRRAPHPPRPVRRP